MIKFYGKPHELRLFLRELGEKYGKNQNMVAIYIMLQKEWDLKNERI